MTRSVSRRRATILGIGFQYASIGVLVIRGIVLVPILAKYIDHEILGAWYASGNILNWVMLSEGGAWLLLRQQTAQTFGSNSRHELGEVVGTGAAIMVAIGVLVATSVVALAPFVPAIFGIAIEGKDSLVTAFLLAGLGMALSLPANIPRAVEQGLQQPFAVNAVFLAAEIVSLIVTIVMIFSGYGVVALGLGILLREVLHNLGNWLLLARTLKAHEIAPKVSLRRCRTMFGALTWISLSNLGRTLSQNVDAFVVSQVIGNPAVLMSEWTKRLWDLVSSLTLKATTSFTPGLAHLHGEGDWTKFRSISTDLLKAALVSAAITLGVGLSFNEAFMGLWVGPDFFAGMEFNISFGIATWLGVLLFAIVEVLFAINEVKIPALIQLGQSAVRVGALFILTAAVGIDGVPLSMLTAIVLGGGFGLTYLWVDRVGFSRAQVMEQLATLIRTTSTVVVLSVIWRAVPSVTGWGSLIAQCTAFVAIAILALAVIEPFVRARFLILSDKIGKRHP